MEDSDETESPSETDKSAVDDASMDESIAVVDTIGVAEGPKMAVSEETNDPKGPGVVEDSDAIESPGKTD